MALNWPVRIGMRIEPEQLLTMAREFRQKHAASIADLQQPLEAYVRQKVDRESESLALDRAQQRVEVPFSMVNLTGGDNGFSR